MKTTDLFSTSSKKLNESLAKTFGKKINFEQFDLDQLQDARNKLRTQLSQVRSESGFNENLENDAYHQAQWMLDAINAEIAERDEHIIESDVDEGAMKDIDYDLRMLAGEDEEELIAALQGEYGSGVADVLNDMMSELQDELASKGMNDVMNDDDKMIEMLWDKLVDEYGGDDDSDEGGETDDNYALSSAGFGSDEDYESINYEGHTGKYKDLDTETGDRLSDWLQEWIDYLQDSDDFGLASDVIGLLDKFYDGDIGFREVQEFVFNIADEPTSPLRRDFIQNFAPNKIKKTQPDLFDDQTNEVSPPGFKGTVKAMKKHKDIDNPYALAWHMKKKGYKSHKKADGSDKNESVKRGEDMTTLREGEVQQASAIVTAKTMVDRVGRWIEELSGMENETLLQLGDSIRDEMGQEQAKAFIEAVAPAIQQALETLKGTRETISNGVNTLATGEAPADMLGAEPPEGGEADMSAPAEPDMMNAEPAAEEPAGDEFGAAEPAAGGIEAAGREKRESIERANNLLKMLAG